MWILFRFFEFCYAFIIYGWRFYIVFQFNVYFYKGHKLNAVGRHNNN